MDNPLDPPWFEMPDNPFPYAQNSIAPTLEEYLGSAEEEGEAKGVFVVFSLGETAFAVEVAFAEEVARKRTLTEVPGAPSFIKGIVSLRGEMIPVMDITERLGKACSSAFFSERVIQPERMLVVSAKDSKLAFLAERIDGMMEIHPRMIKSDGEDKDPLGFIKAVAMFKTKTIKILNMERLMEF
ncbi:MAG: chemotaxis protein CheW [Deltaproteobacteria bacterium]|nr:chemotaxis protein CheW [Deltaproteobacteria bacterium]